VPDVVEYGRPMTRANRSKTTHIVDLLAFALHSLAQAYGRRFLRDVVLRDPLGALRGMWTYGRLLGGHRADQRCLVCAGDEGFVKDAAAAGERLLVGTGFCQKPLRSAGSLYDCPAGRFNHDCLYLSRVRWNGDAETQFPLACAGCSIRTLGRAALQAGSSFAVLTSALDIADDILLPALKEERFTHVLLAICPYSVEPMSLALLICGMQGYILRYSDGSCDNYDQWLRADGGDKPERTVLSRPTMAAMLILLDAIATFRRSFGSTRPTHYQQLNNVFRPC
jgi:hypothetical protein